MNGDAESPSSVSPYAVVVAGLAIVAMLLMPAPSTVHYAAALIGAWLLVATLLRYAVRHRQMLMPVFRRPIPIRFGESLGRFTLRANEDGRRVEVRAGTEVVAEAIATDEQDELVVDLDAVADDDLDAFGAAIGTAIEMVAAADEEEPAERLRARVYPADQPISRPLGGSVLRTIGSRSR